MSGEGIVAAAVYAAVGIVCYLFFGDYAAFTWVDPWLYVYIGLWPLVLFLKFLFWMLVLLGVITIGYGLYDGVVRIRHGRWPHERWFRDYFW
jgi:hypothetical protein